MQNVLHTHQFGHLPLHQATHRNAGGLAHHFGNVLGIHLFFQHALTGLQIVEMGSGASNGVFHLGDLAVADFGGGVEVRFPVDLRTQSFQTLLEKADGGDCRALVFPMGLHAHRLFAQVGQFFVQYRQSLGRRRVSFLGQCHVLDLELANTAFHHIDLGGHGVDFDT